MGDEIKYFPKLYFPVLRESATLPAISAGSGPGAGLVRFTVYDYVVGPDPNVPYPGVYVWITSDEQGTDVVAGPHISGADGKVDLFYLYPGYYWAWAYTQGGLGYLYSNPMYFGGDFTTEESQFAITGCSNVGYFWPIPYFDYNNYEDLWSVVAKTTGSWTLVSKPTGG